MKSLLLLCVLISSLLCSCTGYKTATGTKITTSGGKQLVENNKAQLSLLYYGDYWFHSLNRKTTLNYDQGFVKSIRSQPGKKLLLFTAHSTIEPYCSTAGFLYKDCTLAETINGISFHLKSKLKAENLIVATGNTNTKSYSTLSYELKNSKLKINCSYLEYYFTHDTNVVRIIFWTSDSNKSWLKSESEAILETIRFGIG
ncbi:MAG: hypothetical protein IPP71_03685 [Bacteroidetes bacterium]|nr:hypothetical protein [Bacteroidota bacterium]